MSEDVLGGFEHQVMLAVLRLGSEGYTVPIVDELETLTGRSPAPAAVYTTLRRLESRGLMSSSFADRPGGGRPRRVFKLERGGVDALRRSKASFMRFWDGLTVLDET